MNTTARTRSGRPGQATPDASRRRPARPSPARDEPGQRADPGQSPAREGAASQGVAEQAPARQRPVRQGAARQGAARQGAARQAQARQGAARQGAARQAQARQGAARQAQARDASAQPDPARQPQQRTIAQWRRSSRTPFILVVIGLLAGGLVCLLVINTTLAAGSFQISKLQQENAAAIQRLAQLQQQVSTEQSPGSVEQRALRLGMRMQPVPNFIDLRNGRRYSTAAHLPPGYNVPGYTP